MSLLLNAILPVFTLIMIGYFFKRISFPSHDFWPLADRFTYYVLMPSLLVYKLSFAKINDDFSFDMVYVGIFSIVLVFLFFVILHKFTSFKGPAYTSIIQGGIRYNTYIFLAFIDALYGDKGLVFGMVFITFAIPLINLFCISSFAMYVDNDKVTFKKMVNSIIKNPLIIACFVGGFINFSNIYVPIPIEKTIAILSSAALSMGLLAVGVGLEISHMKYAKIELILSSFVKLVAFPVVMYILVLIFHIDGLESKVLILFSSMPTAVSAYILAKELGGDTKLMSSIVTIQTLLSFVSVGVIISLL